MNTMRVQSFLAQIRGFFAARDNPYAGADLANTQRLGAILWSLVVLLVLALLPVSHPTDAIGSAGWVIAALLLVGGVALGYALVTNRIRSWSAMLAVSYAAVAMLAVLDWLAGEGAPYDRMLLLVVVFVAALHPPRRIAPFMGFVLLAVAAPFVYGGWDSQAASSAGASFVIWSALAVMVSALMSGVRAQRLLLRRGEAEAREEARVDSLTGLPNRRAFDEALEQEVRRARRRRAPLAVGMVDIEQFKEINDRWGHAQGDRCLREIASALRGSLREPELCFRWGGDEFSLILAGSTAEQNVVVGDRLRRTIAESCTRPDGEPIRTRFAWAELQADMSASELVEMAGIALTAGKAQPSPEGEAADADPAH